MAEQKLLDMLNLAPTIFKNKELACSVSTHIFLLDKKPQRSSRVSVAIFGAFSYTLSA